MVKVSLLAEAGRVRYRGKRWDQRQDPLPSQERQERSGPLEPELYKKEQAGGDRHPQPQP